MYRCFAAVPFFLILITIPAKAQISVQQERSASELPSKPKIKAETLAGTPIEAHAGIPVSKPHFKVADKKFWILGGLQVGATIADFETTQWAQGVRPDGGELNPLYGMHPGRTRMYSIGMSLTALQIAMQYRAKAKAHEAGKLKKGWIVGALINAGVHTFLAVHNGQIAGDAPGVCRPGDFCR